MILFALSYTKFGLSIKTLFTMILASCFIIMTTTDIKEKLVDCNIAIGLAIIGILFAYFSGGVNGVVASVLGLAAGAIILEIIARIGYIFSKGRAMGEADTYVAGAIGACFGIQNIIPVLMYSLAASMIFVLPVFFYNKFKANDKLTCIMGVLFALSIVFHIVFQNYLTITCIIVCGVILTYSILKNIKDVENKNYLPFVPALAAGVLYYVSFYF